MNNWLLKQSTNRLLLLFFSPAIFFLFGLFAPFNGEREKLFNLLFVILTLQIAIYFYLTNLFCTKLISVDKNNFIRFSPQQFALLSIAIFACVFLSFFQILFQGKIADLNNILLVIAFAAEIYRSSLIAKIVVSLEKNQKQKFKNYFATFYLTINPLFEIWIMHNRTLKLINQNSL